MPKVTPSSEWFRSRSYLHFDQPIGEKKALKLVTSFKRVKEHSFYPLISYEVTSKKLKKDASGKLNVTLKERPIAYSAHKDGHIYAYYAQILSKLYEEQLLKYGLEGCVLAFRSLGKSNIDFAHEAFTQIKESGECSAVALDFSKFFDTLDHSILKQSWCSLLDVQRLPDDHFNVFKSITKFSKVDRTQLYKKMSISINNPKNGRIKVCKAKDFRELVRGGGLIFTNKNNYGIPQGSPISALLSNIYMLEFDKAMKTYVDIHGGYYYRYCDDMLFIVPTALKKKVAGFAAKEVKKLKVALNPDKTELRTFRKVANVLSSDQPLQYLGFIFDGENAFIRSSSLARYSEKMRRGVNLAKQTMNKYNNIRSGLKLDEKDLYKKKLYSRYTHLGGRNFVTYGLRAARKMDSKSIRKQLKPLWRRFHEEMQK
ncbi:antiviral reverse transcriptase Drt2 [Pseudoalteromonas aurantia]|uniref:Reverse transcriptase domain-containing protein n=1 Tax=Pseudoalteromonas aurantia TaxID=43654 RepID=A0ABY2VUG8_9GAMM|nr:antiviral reverse transcriptase Drt2 [Pseudoalteromonas aurantia]TMO71931.1 hypothetical protein CWC20_16310 [Pseudoalteromonas aurantia]